MDNFLSQTMHEIMRLKVICDNQNASMMTFPSIPTTMNRVTV